MIREIISEVAGYAHYEKRIIEMLKIGTGSSGKKALKLVKKRLGTMRRAKAKRNELEIVMQSMKHLTEHKEDEHKEHKDHKDHKDHKKDAHKGHKKEDHKKDEKKDETKKA